MLLLAAKTAWAGAFIQNPSFESNYNSISPHYSAITAWSGGNGVNDLSLDPSGPFQDNGSTLLVSRGVRDTLPLRWNCPREVIVVQL